MSCKNALHLQITLCKHRDSIVLHDVRHDVRHCNCQVTQHRDGTETARRDSTRCRLCASRKRCRLNIRPAGWGHDYSEGCSNDNFRRQRGKCDLLCPLRSVIGRPCINSKMFKLPVAAPMNKKMSN
ncbi:hypothetical protein TSAR_010309 [Trichomalopsis sarcophagae]|uniref:Uncharacterized protein n=1 Tax=Trichomalopsis sarcophagae TaxID=543379 RepID=A0A232EHL9_9HYME|nr:hypothetical protein TSAR_010309 [Trichomalopsis sarcophagae]